MKQLTMFDDDRRPPSPAEMMRGIRITWLTVLSDGEPHEFGEGQRREPYPPAIAKAVGSVNATLHRLGIIEPVGAVKATRPTRHSSIARQWKSTNPERCRQLADADRRWLNSHWPKDTKNTGESTGIDSPAVNSTTLTTNGNNEHGKAV